MLIIHSYKQIGDNPFNESLPSYIRFMGDGETRRFDSGDVLTELAPLFPPNPRIKLRKDRLLLSAGEASL